MEVEIGYWFKTCNLSDKNNLLKFEIDQTSLRENFIKKGLIIGDIVYISKPIVLALSLEVQPKTDNSDSLKLYIIL